MGRRRMALAITALVTLALSSCGGSDSGGSDDGVVDVVASFFPVAEAAQRVGGDEVRVRNLTPVGAEPHDIELSSSQVDRLLDADVVLYLGRGFQPAVEKVAERRDAGSVDLLDSVELEKGDVEAAGEEGLDPHFWLDPELLVAAVGAVTEALAEVSPGDAATFRANAERYTGELRALDGEFRQALASCRRKEIVTSHAAFFYLARRYGLSQLPITGLSPEAEPDAGRLADLADQVRAKGITTVFYEELVSPKVAQALAREAGVGTAVLSPLEGLSKEEAEAGKDYAAVMRDNLAALRHALDCP